MKKILLFVVLFQINFVVFSQMTKIEVAEYIYNQLYDYNSPDNYVASGFPNPFYDLPDNTSLTKKIKLLSYLEYDDDKTCFFRDGEFFGNNNIQRIFVLVYIMEAWNIPTAYSSTSPFPDVETNMAYYEYVVGAYNAGIIGSSYFRPWDIITYDELLYDFMTGIFNSGYYPVSESTLQNMDNYFIPNNYTPYNIGTNRGLEQGVFSHYAKNSFVIPDIKLNLNFSHSYSTQMVELDESFFPIKPLGRGWTHTYNSYAIKENINGETIYTIVWPDGTIHIWNEYNFEYITKGVYDYFNESSSTRIYITKKNQIRYTFQRLDSGRNIYYLREIRDRNDNEINIYYENAVENNTKRIKSVASPSGKRLNFEYRNNTDLIDVITDPIGRNIEFEYQGVGSTFVYNYPVLTTFTDARQHNTNYAYDINNPSELHPLNRIQLPEGNLITAQYNDVQLTEYSVNNNSVGINVNYDDYNAITSDVTVPMPNGGTQNYHYEYNENGILTQFQNDTNNISFSYNAPENININRPSNTNKNGLNIDYEYDDKGNVTKITTEGVLVERFWYHPNNDLQTYKDANGHNTSFYYTNGNLIEVEDALNKSSYFTYDTHGQLKSATNQEGIQIDYTYENDGVIGSISAPENISSSFVHDDINRLLSKTVNGQTSSYTYDPNDNLKTQTNIGGLTTTFSYDKNDNLTKIKNANNVDTDFQYNDKDQLESETFVSSTKHYTYNSDGSLQTYTKPSGATINYQYDSFGRIEQTGTITDVDYNNNGLVSSIANADSRYDFTYNIVNRLRFVENSNTNEIVEYSYDDVGNITEMRYPNNPLNLFVRYQYDAKNRLIEVKLTINGNSNTIVAYEYLDDDRILNILYSNGVYTQYQYDDAGRKTGIFHYKPDDSLLFSEILTLDNRGNVSNSQTHYATATEIPLGISSIEEQNFTYDDNNHIQNGYNVNSDGNLTSSPNSSFSYNIDDQLTNRNTNGDTFSYEYDAYGNRISKIKNGYVERYIWDIVHKNPIMKTDDSGLNITHYNIFGLSLETQVSSDGIIHFYHGDIRGNVVVTTSESAEIGIMILAK